MFINILTCGCLLCYTITIIIILTAYCYISTSCLISVFFKFQCESRDPWSFHTWLVITHMAGTLGPVHSIDNNYNERHFIPVKLIIRRDAYMCNQWWDVMTIIIILLQHLYKVIIVYLASRLHTQEEQNVDALL